VTNWANPSASAEYPKGLLLIRSVPSDESLWVGQSQRHRKKHALLLTALGLPYLQLINLLTVQRDARFPVSSFIKQRLRVVGPALLLRHVGKCVYASFQFVSAAVLRGAVLLTVS
jgi:hypothetical protein